MQSLKWLNVTRQLRTKSEDDGATTLAKALEDRHIDDSSNRGSCDVSNKRVSSWLEHGTHSQPEDDECVHGLNSKCRTLKVEQDD